MNNDPKRLKRLDELEFCVEPNAPFKPCCICGSLVKTCERFEPVVITTPGGSSYNDYVCPAHPCGCELSDGRWVCSQECWDKAVDN